MKNNEQIHRNMVNTNLPLRYMKVITGSFLILVAK